MEGRAMLVNLRMHRKGKWNPEVCETQITLRRVGKRVYSQHNERVFGNRRFKSGQVHQIEGRLAML